MNESIGLKHKSASDFFRLVKGKISRLEIRVEQSPYGGLEPSTTENEIAIRKKFNQSVEGIPHKKMGWTVRLRIQNSQVPRNGRYSINISELLHSTLGDGMHDIFTCWCGYLQCAGGRLGVAVLSDPQWVVWKIHSPRPSRIFVFNREQYRTGIHLKSTEFLNKYKALSVPREEKGNYCEHLKVAIWDIDRLDEVLGKLSSVLED